MLAQTAMEWTASVGHQFLKVPPEILDAFRWTEEHPAETLGGIFAGIGLCVFVGWLLRKGRKWWMSKDKRKNIVDAHITDGIFYYLLEEKRRKNITQKEFMRYVRKFGLLRFGNVAKTKAMIKYRLGHTNNGKGKVDYTPSPLPDRVEKPELIRNTYPERRRTFTKLERILVR